MSTSNSRPTEPDRRARRPALIERLSHLQTERPLLPLSLVAVVTLVFAIFAARLELRTRYESLLPESQPSVKELHRLEERTSGAQTILIVLEGGGRDARRAMGDALVPKLLELGPDTVSSAEDGVHEARKFLEPRAGLFLERAELEKLRADIDARWRYEVGRRSGLALDDDEPPPPLDADELQKRFEATGRKRVGKLDQFPDGYYEDAEALIVVARSPIAGGDLGHIRPAVERVRAAVEALRSSRPELQKVHASYAGDMATGLEEYGVLRDDLVNVGATGIAVVLLAVVLYFMRLRALFVMGATILVALVWTFGLAQLVIGHLNIATAFLVSIIAGNGINIGILYQARYFEERANGVPPKTALRISVRETWQPTAIAAVASAASYGSLLITDFRAFRDFGFIAATGMLFCWMVKTLMVPPLLILLDRGAPGGRESQVGVFDRVRSWGMSYGRPFAALVPRAPRLLVGLWIALTVAGIAGGIHYVASDPLEYDLRKIGNDRTKMPELQHAWDVGQRILGGSSGTMVVVTDLPEEARELAAKLEARWDAAPETAKPFVRLLSLWSLIPPEQEAKIPTLLAIADRLERAHARGLVRDEDWKRLARIMPPKDLRPFGAADLPAAIARPFTDRSGTRGTLVLVEPEASEDLHYLVRYADSFRQTRLDSGKVVGGSGRAVVFADMLKAVLADIPKSVALSLSMTLVAVFLTFRRGVHRFAVLVALLMGVAGIALFLFASGTRLNFINFAALPVTFGIGVDYSVNVMQRYHADGSKDILSVLRTTGGAVVLCSLTTTLGYLVLLGSQNLAIRSLGSVAVVGEVSCLLAAVVALPAACLLVERRRQRPSAKE